MDNYNNIQLVTQPQNLNKTLFNHQLASIYQMEKMEREQMIEYAKGIKETRLGVLADKTGYGKTLSMIGLISRDKMEWNLEVPFVKEVVTTESSGLVRNREIERYDKLPTSLILVSPSIVSQWKQEFSHSDLKVEIVASRRDVDFVEVEKYDVIIVTVPMYNNLAMSYSRYAWKRFIFDEPGHVRVSGMKEINAGFNWLVTATPEAITLKHRNCSGSFMKKIIGDGWLKFEEKFEGMILRNDLDFVKTSFEMPPTHNHYYKCFQPILRTISGMVNDTIHTMIAAGNIEGAIVALGGKKTKNIIELVKQEKLEEQAKIQTNIHIYRDIKKDNKKLKIALEQEKRIKEQLDQLNIRFESMLKDNCPICTGKLNNPVLEPKCQNLFCGQCLLTWLEKKQDCPMCRSPIDTTDLIYLSNENSTSNDSTSVIVKEKQYTPLEKTLEILLSKNNDGKFIIFSEHNASFDPICRLLNENKISFTLVKGTHNSRKKSIDNFKYGDTKVIFLNSNFNGAGINLQEATDIILYHEMSISTQNQIIGRANRIGRSKPLQIHHLQVTI
jgi:SNF2 family DNA or RNA helicase